MVIDRIASEPPPGRIEEGWYEVVDDILTIRDLDGNEIGARRLYGDEDPRGLARALLLERAAASAFDQPILYPKTKIA